MKRTILLVVLACALVGCDGAMKSLRAVRDSSDSDMPARENVKKNMSAVFSKIKALYNDAVKEMPEIADKKELEKYNDKLVEELKKITGKDKIDEGEFELTPQEKAEIEKIRKQFEKIYDERIRDK